MEYHTVYQYLQFIERQQKAFNELSDKERWCLHSSAVANSFRRIRSLACSIPEFEYVLVHRLVKEVENELAIIKERLSSCSLAD